MSCTHVVPKLLRRYALLLGLALLGCGLGGAQGARAESIETVVSPGKMSRAHAKYEGDCAQCHVRFDRK